MPILHLYLPGIGCSHLFKSCENEVEAPPSRGGDGWCWLHDARTAGVLANCQSTTMFLARSITISLVSVTSSQTLILRCFQMLQSTVAKHWVRSTNKFSHYEKIASVVEAVFDRACWIKPQIAVLFQTLIAKGQAKNMWVKSSWSDAQLAQLVGKTTPLSRRQTRVGKQPGHMCHTKFLTFGGTLRFEIPDQYPRRQR